MSSALAESLAQMSAGDVRLALTSGEERTEPEPESARDTKQVIVIRRDLRMRRGKEIAQGAHAAMLWLTEKLGRPAPEFPDFHVVSLTEAELHWLRTGTRKITVRVSSEEELLTLQDAANVAGLRAHVVADAGLTEFGGVPTLTALAIGPDWEDVMDAVTGKLELY
jgi:peptidyl-tRNA hydrolase, PTH2 family